MSGTAQALEEADEEGTAEVAVRWDSGGGVTKKISLGKTSCAKELRIR
jgi:hypothetical protein